jgi:hypothetical protein
MSEHTVHLIGGDDDETATLSATPVDGLCHITFRYRDQTIEASATDYFEAFSKIRLRLEEHRLIPFCYGASLSVFPSGMCRDMSAGTTAYRLMHGKKPERGDLVRIFDSGADVIPAFVARQREYFDEWLKSTAP